jgi:hypothetical protein
MKRSDRKLTESVSYLVVRQKGGNGMVSTYSPLMSPVYRTFVHQHEDTFKNNTVFHLYFAGWNGTQFVEGCPLLAT